MPEENDLLYGVNARDFLRSVDARKKGGYLQSLKGKGYFHPNLPLPAPLSYPLYGKRWVKGEGLERPPHKGVDYEP
jgi:hypothetical protein